MILADPLFSNRQNVKRLPGFYMAAFLRKGKKDEKTNIL